MSLYALGDLHLHFQTELKNASQRRGGIWINHEETFRDNCARMIGDDDTLVLIGDHSWGRNLAECEQDLAYIEALPGRKILIRGNHDMFWDAKKTDALNAAFEGRLLFLQNNYYPYEEYALVGTKGFTFEGPFWMDSLGRVVDWDREAEEHADKIIRRELGRLRASFEAAKADGYRKFIMFLHYPPTDILQEKSAFTDMAEEYGAERVIYAHSHGEKRFHDSIHGDCHGVRYDLASGDYLKWLPMKIM